MDEEVKKSAKGEGRRIAAGSIGAFLGAAVLETFFVLCLMYFYPRWRPAFFWTSLLFGTALNFSLFAVAVVFLCKKKPSVCRFCFILYLCTIFFAVCFYLLLVTGFFEVLQDEARFQAYLERAGNWMAALFITLQFLQVVILPIPSTVTVAVGAVLFGPFWGSVYSLIGIVLGSLAAFLVGRYAGNRVAAWIVGKETLDKWLKKVRGKDKLLLTAMFLLPAFPDDVLCFIAGFSSMSAVYFITVIILSRVLAIFTTSYIVKLIPFTTWWGILIWCILAILTVLLFVVLYRKSDAILGWFERKFGHVRKVKTAAKQDEFSIEIVGPDGLVVEKGVKRGEEEEIPKQKGGKRDDGGNVG